MLTVKSLKMMLVTRSLSTRVRREVMISQSRDLLSNTALEDWAVKNINLAEKSVMILSNNITRTPATATKSRRLLPRPPQDPSPESELCSSVSVTTPPQLQESDEESSYVTHTQHLVDVMEERLKQVRVYRCDEEEQY